MELPFRYARVKSSQEDQHANGDKGSENAIENGVEKADFS